MNGYRIKFCGYETSNPATEEKPCILKYQGINSDEEIEIHFQLYEHFYVIHVYASNELVHIVSCCFPSQEITMVKFVQQLTTVYLDFVDEDELELSLSLLKIEI